MAGRMQTIRSYFNRRTRRAFRSMAAGFVVVALAMVLGAASGHVGVAGVGAGIGLVIVCAALWRLDTTRCPRCSARLLPTRRINFCPYCGVSFDAGRC
jgi:hypothetical protein